MRSKIKEYAILDFRGKAVDQLQDHFWYIIYDTSFSKVTIRTKGKQDQILPLFGGK